MALRSSQFSVTPDTNSSTVSMQAYKVIEAEIVNDQVFSQFIYKIIPDKVHMWTFKKQLNTQMALSGATLLRPITMHGSMSCSTSPARCL